ncbi:MAG: hypothetical protein IPI41_12125 [Flavobacteriales bacterium]|nr:hypothetical protein [Flavobacteriales bacterium]
MTKVPTLPVVLHIPQVGDGRPLHAIVVPELVQGGIVHEQRFGRCGYSVALCGGHARHQQPFFALGRAATLIQQSRSMRGRTIGVDADVLGERTCCDHWGHYERPSGKRGEERAVA